MPFLTRHALACLLLLAACATSGMAANVVLTADAGPARTTEGIKPVVLDGGQSTVTKGTASGWTISHGGGYAATTTVLTLTGGTGGFLIGDTVRATGDNTDYVVTAWDGAGTLTIAAPGLVKALANATPVNVSTAIIAWRWTRQDNGTSLGNGKALAVSLRGAEGSWGETGGAYVAVLTVQDSAGHTATSTMTITVTTGNAPSADAGGPYAGGAGGPPVFFNGGNATDDYGIIDWIWDTDVDQGTGTPNGGSATLYGRTPMYTYATAGTKYARLTVRDGRGQTGSAIIPVTIKDPVTDDLPPQVSTIPFKGNPNLPHPAISGVALQLRGVARDYGAMTYRWSFGDGSYDPILANAPAAVADPRAIETSHVYSGDPGKPFVATLTVYDNQGRASFATSKVGIEADTPQTRADIATEKALWYLHKVQSQSPLGRWSGYGSYYNCATASALQAFCINGSRPYGDAQVNPYCDTVRNGFNYLWTSGITALGTNAVNTPNGDAWSGRTTSLSSNSDRPIYETGTIMDAIAATEMPLGIVESGTVAPNRRYVDVLRDMVNMYVWGQSAGGGWQYAWNSGNSDNSASQWAAIGMKAAEDVFGIAAPAYTKSRNQSWMDASYNPNYSGYPIFGYTNNNSPVWGYGYNTTPSALVQMAWNGTPSSDYRWQACETSMRTWFTDAGSGFNNHNFYGLYAVTKSMHLAQPQRIDLLAGTFDWFGDATNGLRTRLLGWQLGNGSWSGGCDSAANYNIADMATAWGVIMLSPNLFVQAPVAIQDTPPAWGFDVELQFDASRSFHIDPNKNIVQYEWDLGSGVYEVTTAQPRSPLARKTYADPHPGVPGDQPQTYTIRLRVTDEFGQSDVATQTLVVSEPPHAPFARPGGPYLAMEGFPVTLNAGDSFDIDPTDFVTSYGWDWDNTGIVANLEWTLSPTISHTFAAPGEYVVGLVAKDNGVFNGGTPLNSLFGYATIEVMPNQPPYAIITNAGSLNVAEGVSLTLDGSSSYDPDPGQSITWSWDLAYNGSTFNPTASGVRVGRTWMANGNYLIALRVSDGAKTNLTTATVHVSDQSPTAHITWSPFSPFRTQTVQFYDTSSSPADAITGWSWTFGDGGTATTQNPTHAYAAVGTYTVALTVTDSDGSTSSTSSGIVVSSDNILVSKTSCTVTEGGATDQYTIQLTSTPPEAVTVTLHLPGRVQLVAGPASHAFTSTAPWTVAVQALDDALRQASDPEIQTITHTTTTVSGNTAWDNLPVADVQVTVHDNDFPVMQLSGNGQGITNGDSSPTAGDGSDFQTRRVGSAAVDQVFTIGNAGSVNLNLTGGTPVTVSGTGASAFTIIQPAVAVIAPGGTSTFTVRFTPPATVADRTATIAIANDAPGAAATWTFTVHGAAGQPTIAVSGNGVGIANNDILPAPADSTAFGNAVVGGAALVHTFTISNAGGIPLNLTGSPYRVVISGSEAGDFTVETQPAATPLAAGGSIPVRIDFAPAAVGLRNATVTIASDDPGTPSFTFAIGGTGILPVVALSGNSTAITFGANTPVPGNGTDFGDTKVAIGQTIHAFTISNAGVGDLQLNDPRVSFSGPDAGDFTVVTHPDALLADGASTTVAVAFTPAVAGPATATLVIRSNDPIHPLFTCALAGNGVITPAPVLAVTGNGIPIIGGADPMGGNYTYLGYAANGVPVTRSFTISNSGDADMTVSALDISGANAGDFSLDLGATTLPITLHQGQSFAFNVIMTPNATGARNAVVTVTTSTTTFPFPVRGYGLGGSSAAVINVTGLNNHDILNGSLLPTLDAGTDAGTIGPAATTLAFTIQNLGNAALHLGATPIAISGTGSAAYTIATPPTSPVPAGGATSFTLSFNPASLGTAQATVTISSDATVNPYTFAITGRRAFVFTGQPADSTTNEDATATFTVAVHAVDAVSYQWYVSSSVLNADAIWTAMPGAISADLPVIASVATNGTHYRCRVSTPATTAVSAAATLTANLIPTLITADPAPATVVIGQPAHFTVTATGKPVLAWQWRKCLSGQEVFHDIPGAITATYDIPVTDLTVRDAVFQCVATGANGLTATSASALLTLTIPPPQVLTVSGDATVYVGDDALFSITAAGTSLTYQWQSNPGSGWSDIADATGTSHTLTAAALAQNGLPIRCVISDVDAVTAVSAVMTLHVSPTAITADPANTTVVLGQPASFTITATGKPTLAWQWQIRHAGDAVFSDIAGANTAIYAIPATTLAVRNAAFRCVATGANALTATSASALLTLTIPPPQVLSASGDATVYAGDDAAFSITASGTSLTYQWQSNPGSGWSAIANATGSAYSLAAAALVQDGLPIRCVVSDVDAVTALSAVMTLHVSPTAITADPVDTTVVLGQPASFTITATGKPTLTWQWQIRHAGDAVFSDIAGANTAIYAIPATTLAVRNAAFRCVATGANALTATSASALLTLTIPPPQVLTVSGDATVYAGDDAAFAITASGTNLAYQWQSNPGSGWGAIANATGSAYTLSAATNGQDGLLIRCVVSDVDAVTAVSPTMVLHVGPMAITADPVDTTVVLGQPASFAITATGKPDLAWQWQIEHAGDAVFSDIPGANAAIYAIPATTLAVRNARFRCVATGANGVAATSAGALLTLTIPPPQVLTASGDATVYAGDDATFSITAAGTSLAYQWQSNPGSGWSAIAYATGSACTITAAALAQDGLLIRCLVSDVDAVTAVSPVMTLHVSPTTITADPVDTTVVLGQPASFAITATGKPALAWQWQIRIAGDTVFSDIPGANAASYAIPATTLAVRNAAFRCVATGANGLTATSAGALLTLTIPPPQVLTVSGDATVYVGDDAAFSITAAGTGLTCQWQSNPGSGWSAIANATGSAYTLTAASLAQDGVAIRCVVSDVDAVTAVSAVMTLHVSSTAITADPVNATVELGQPAGFTITATGKPTLTWQWQIRIAGDTVFSDIPGANAATHAIPATTLAMRNAAFRCVATSGNGVAATSAEALLTLTIPPPQVLTVSGDATVYAGDAAAFSITAAGTSLTCQWQSNPGSGWSDIPSATGTAYTLSAAANGQDGLRIRCVVSDVDAATAVSQDMVLHIGPMAITANPVDATVVFGQPARFAITATGKPALTWQWQIRHAGDTVFSDIPGANAASYDIATTSLAVHNARFRCVVTSGNGVAATSAEALLTLTIVAPGWITTPDVVVLAGTPWEYLAAVAGGSGPALPTIAGSDIPGWITVTPLATGHWRLAGQAPAAGTSPVVLRVANGGATSQVQAFTITAIAPITAKVSTPVIATATDGGATPYNALCLATDEGVAAFRAALAGKDSTQARGFAWDATIQDYVEFPQEPVGGLTPFHAIFLVTRVPLDLPLGGVPKTMPATLVVRPGWNFLGIPPLHDGTAVQTSHPWSAFHLQALDGTPITGSAAIDLLGTVGSGDAASTRPWQWDGEAYVQVDTLITGVGYWIKNNSRTDDFHLVRSNGPAPTPPASARATTRDLPGGGAAVEDRGQPPAPPGQGAVGGASNPQEAVSSSGGCGMGGGSASLGMFLLLLLRLQLRGLRRR